MSREERLAQAEECLASGMTVRDWCAANGVPEATMYVWVRRLCKCQAVFSLVG
jgi:transposase-like protein